MIKNIDKELEQITEKENKFKKNKDTAFIFLIVLSSLTIFYYSSYDMIYLVKQKLLIYILSLLIMVLLHYVFFRKKRFHIKNLYIIFMYIISILLYIPTILFWLPYNSILFNIYLSLPFLTLLLNQFIFDFLYKKWTNKNDKLMYKIYNVLILVTAILFLLIVVIAKQFNGIYIVTFDNVTGRYGAVGHILSPLGYVLTIATINKYIHIKHYIDSDIKSI